MGHYEGRITDEDRANVRRGAALLDERLPGWENIVNLNAFSISDTDKCVLAQCYGSFSAGLAYLDLHTDAYDVVTDTYRNDVAYNGFCAGYHTSVWVEEIEERRFLASLPSADKALATV